MRFRTKVDVALGVQPWWEKLTRPQPMCRVARRSGRPFYPRTSGRHPAARGFGCAHPEREMITKGRPTWESSATMDRTPRPATAGEPILGAARSRRASPPLVSPRLPPASLVPAGAQPAADAAREASSGVSKYPTGRPSLDPRRRARFYDALAADALGFEADVRALRPRAPRTRAGLRGIHGRLHGRVRMS